MYQLNCKKLSTARPTLMGLAMLLVVFFHSSLTVSSWQFLDFTKKSGDIGVDIFLFVSGIGIYFALQDGRNYKAYALKRFFRILPGFILINGLWFVLHDLILSSNGFLAFFYDITSLSFWLNGSLTTWYLSSLLILQLITPYYLKALKKRPHLCEFSISIIFIIALFIRVIPSMNHLLGHLLIFIMRIPIYLLGLSFGKLVFHERTIQFSWPALIFASLFCIATVCAAYGCFPFYIPWAIKYIAYFPLAVIISIFAVNIPENPFLHFLGTRSLEIYLLHEKILWGLGLIFDHVLGLAPQDEIFVNVISILFTFICAEILHRICKIFLTRKEHGVNV